MHHPHPHLGALAHATWRRLVSLGALAAALSGCGTTASGGGYGAPAVTAGDPCYLVQGSEQCGLAGGFSSRLQCSGGVWIQLEGCAPPSYCATVAAGVTQCAVSGGGGQDAGAGSDAGTGGQDSGSTPGTDTGSAGDTGSAVDSSSNGDSGSMQDGAETEDSAGDASSTPPDAALMDAALGDTDAGSAAVDVGTTADDGTTDTWNADGIASDAAPDGNSAFDAGVDGTVDASPQLACVPSCTAGSYCVAGSCVVPSCALPAPNSLAGVQRLTSFALLSEFEGCDVDLDGTPNNVIGKIAGLYGQLNYTIANIIKGGKDVGFLVPAGWNTAGTQFQLAMAAGDWNGSTATLTATTWDLQGSGACVLAKPMQATSSQGSLEAGGTQFFSPFSLFGFGVSSPMFATTSGAASVYGNVPASGPWTSTTNGSFCGMVPSSALDAWIDSIPNDVLAESGFDKATVKGLMSSLLKPDIDFDGDGTKESLSFAYTFTSALVPVSGYK